MLYKLYYVKMAAKWGRIPMKILNYCDLWDLFADIKQEESNVISTYLHKYSSIIV